MAPPLRRRVVVAFVIFETRGIRPQIVVRTKGTPAYWREVVGARTAVIGSVVLGRQVPQQDGSVGRSGHDDVFLFGEEGGVGQRRVFPASSQQNVAGTTTRESRVVQVPHADDISLRIAAVSDAVDVRRLCRFLWRMQRQEPVSSEMGEGHLFDTFSTKHSNSGTVDFIRHVRAERFPRIAFKHGEFFPISATFLLFVGSLARRFCRRSMIIFHHERLDDA
mmetsp:Transcript_27891/g.63864  ORF Transcript_27891/g.63864 Transcript_27891/m.63864 type:complete len:221 (-) Transcript_27891:342-1004(-)